MSEKTKWLLEQIPEWVSSGFVSADKARLIERRYQAVDGAEPSDLVSKPLAPMAVFASLVMALALNYLISALDPGADHLASVMLLAAVLLVAPSAALAWLLAPGKLPESLYFLREPALLLQSICVLSACSLLFEYYWDEPAGDAEFTESVKRSLPSVVWLPYALALMYATRSHVLPFLFTLVVAVNAVWLSLPWMLRDYDHGLVEGAGLAQGLSALLIGALVAFVGAYLFIVRRQLRALGGSRPRLSALYLWSALMCIAALVNLPIIIHKMYFMPLSSMVFATVYAVGRCFFVPYSRQFEYQYRYRPFEFVGLLGIVATAIKLGYWGDELPSAEEGLALPVADFLAALPGGFYLVFAVLLAAWLGSVWLLARRGDYGGLPIALFPALSLISLVLLFFGFDAGFFQWVYIYYLALGAGLWMIFTGIATFQHQVLNTGMVVWLCIILVAIVGVDSPGDALRYVCMMLLAAAVLALFVARQWRILKTGPDGAVAAVAEGADVAASPGAADDGADVAASPGDAADGGGSDAADGGSAAVAAPNPEPR